jgi:hypothetical protein
MKAVILLCIALAVVASALQFNASPCHIQKGPRVSHVRSPLPHEYMNLNALPDAFEYGCSWKGLVSDLTLAFSRLAGETALA